MDDKIRAISVSNRQFVLLNEVARKGGITLERMLALSQMTGGSVVRRGLIAYNQDAARFVLTESGLAVLDIYKHTDIGRLTVDAPLSKYIRGVRQALRMRARGTAAA